MSNLNPGRIHQALTSYQLAMAMKGALELDLFTHIAAGITLPAGIAERCQATEKGVRVLCDYLTVHGFLSKAGTAYDLLPDTGPLLDRNSPQYMGTVAGFFTHPVMIAKYNDVAALVRRGGAIDHTLEPNEQMWVEFARRMAPMFVLPATRMSELLELKDEPQQVLDVAAGHGVFGIQVAKVNPSAFITFQDWENVLDVARENAMSEGMEGRFRLLPGSAFEVDFHGPYDLALLPNFLHHFDATANVRLLEKVREALRPGARVAIVEFVPNDDRITPPDGALFAMRMLGTTPNGDAYTAAEIDRMLHDAGFGSSHALSLAPAHQSLIVASRR